MSNALSNSLELNGETLQEVQLVEEAQQFAAARSATRMNRRRMLAGLGLAAGAAGTLGLAGCTTEGATAPIASPTTAPSMVDVLNFALNLEYFEASLYSYVVTGTGLSAADMGATPGTVSGGAKVTFQYSNIANIAANLMQEEVEHVEFLRNAIAGQGATPVSMPSLNLAALGAITNDQTFVTLARTIEAVGVSAYEGAAGYLAGSAPLLTYAVSVHDLEAQHEAALRQACIFFPGGAVASPAADSMDIPPTLSAIFNTNPTTGLNTSRTISQVLQIVYNTPGVTGTTSGGFFPNGFNGNVYIS